MVTARRPTWLRLLSRFTDPKGEPVAVQWLTKDEKRKLKDLRKSRAQAEAERATYGDPAEAFALKATLDKRAHGMFDQLTERRINISKAPIELVATLSRSMASTVSLLRRNQRASMREITDTIARECALTAHSAQREAYALASLLTATDRAQRVGPTLELK